MPYLFYKKDEQGIVNLNRKQFRSYREKENPNRDIMYFNFTLVKPKISIVLVESVFEKGGVCKQRFMVWNKAVIFREVFMD